MKQFIFITAMLSLLCMNAVAQDPVTKSLPIDTIYRKCLDSASNKNAYGMIHCACKARDAWDTEITNHLKLLKEKLPADQKQVLETSQKNWLAYRDAEIALSNKIYGAHNGAASKSAPFVVQMQLLKQRALDLKNYCETLK